MPRGRKRKEVVEDSDSAPPHGAPLQQPSPLFPAPVQGSSARPAHGRVTRQSIAMLKQCASSTSPVKCPLQNRSTPNTTGARRVLLGVNDKPCPDSLGLQAFQRHISDFPHKNEVPTPPVISLSYCSPHAEGDHCRRNDFPAANLTSKLLLETEVCQVFQSIVQSQNMLPTRGATLALNATMEGPEKIATSYSERGIRLTRSTSFNLTEIADMCKDSSMNDDEVESTFFPDLVTIKGYRMKEEVAPLLRDIFARYGDIAQDSVLKSSESRSHFLEVVCHIYENLKNTNLTEITFAELDAMLHKVDDLESMKLNVGWLHAKVTEIKEVKDLLRDYAGHKEEKAEIARKEKELESCEVDLVVMQQKVLLLKDVLTAMKTKHEQSTQKFLKDEKVKALFRNGLVDGLL